ncbi:MAG TPA: protease inhibitor I9 family protein, partial [Terriglobales bacterium]
MKLILRAIVALGIFAGALNAFAQASDEMVKSGDRSKAANNIYIVEMSDKPVVAYEGGIQGLPATKPRKGQKIDPNSTAVVNYVNYLNDRHGRALSATGGKKIYDYNYTFNGFAAELTPEQAGALKSTPGVLNVSKD